MSNPRRLATGLMALLLAVPTAFTHAAGAQNGERVRTRDLGVAPGIFAPGRLNAITDVEGVRVGQATVSRGNSVRTGVTAVFPHGDNAYLWWVWRVLAVDRYRKGSVDAGTGTVAFGWKGGIGTSSRVLPAALGGWTVGVLVQTNYGGVLQVLGAPVGRRLGRYAFQDVLVAGPADEGRSGPLGCHFVAELRVVANAS